MARVRDQEARREQILKAATACALKRGLFQLRVRDVAKQLGLTEGAVLYYFQTLEELRLHVYRRASQTWFDSRANAIDPADSAAEQLVSLVTSGLTAMVPEVRLLDEPVSSVTTVPALRAVADALFDKDVTRYQLILERGSVSRDFDLQAPALDAARNLVSLEESYRTHVLARSSITADIGLGLVLSYGSLVTGCDLTAISTSGHEVDVTAGRLTLTE